MIPKPPNTYRVQCQTILPHKFKTGFLKVLRRPCFLRHKSKYVVFFKKRTKNKFHIRVKASCVLLNVV